jgi:hypothetical protein
MAVLILAGALIWYRPFLTRQQQPVASVPAPAGLFSLANFAVPPRGVACLSEVTLTPKAELAQFIVRPATPSPHGGPPIDLVLSAPSYHYVASVAGGYPGGSGTLPITPPKREEIGSACFVDKGNSAAVLTGTTERRTISRSQMKVNGRAVVGNIGLTFLQTQPQSIADRLGEVFAHASNLTDHLVPAWLIWVLAVVVAFTIPIATVAAFYRALREDEAAAV